MPTGRVALTVLSATVFASAAALVARAIPAHNIVTLVLAVVAPYAAVLALLAGVLALWNRAVILAAIGLLVGAIGLWTQVSWYWLGHSSDIARHQVIRVLSLNIGAGDADAEQFVRTAESTADVIVVAELTPEAAQRLARSGIGRSFPHSQLVPAPLAGGIGTWSRYPMLSLRVPEHEFSNVRAARIDVPGLPFSPMLVSIHVKSPLAEGRDTVSDWSSGMANVADRLDDLAATAGQAPVIVAGDFNATPDHRQFRDLLTNGYRDAVDQLGAGFAPTFPAGAWCPPLVTIDHVLTRNAQASSIRTVDIVGSDHLGLLAEVSMPVGR